MIQLKNVRYVPEMFCKLISLTKAMKNGYEVIGKNNRITLQSGKQKISFDRVIQSGKGILLGMKTEIVKKKDNQVKYTEKEFHDMLGHPNNHACHITARNLGYKVTGNMNKCEDCARGKQRKKNLNKIEYER